MNAEDTSSRDEDCEVKERRTGWVEIGVLVLIVLALGKTLSMFGLFNATASVGSTVSFGAAFLIGLVAASSSCIAVSGGLLLSVAVNYAKSHDPKTPWQKFRPHLFFNAGRLISYAVLGGVVGAVGQAIGVNSLLTGILTLAAAVLMIATGLSILQRGPIWLRNLQPRPPKFLSNRILDASGKEHPVTPFLMGAATFFLPCGFTQALQLYALTTGSWSEGALTLLAFALGTLPALLALGAAASLARGGFGKKLIKFSGALALVLGLSNITNAMTILGMPMPVKLIGKRPAATPPSATNGTFWDGQYQVAQMEVASAGYSPAEFVVEAGKPVKWEITMETAEGCLSVIQIPKFGVRKRLVPGDSQIVFTPTEPGEAVFSCSMGMFRGRFIVVPQS